MPSRIHRRLLASGLPLVLALSLVPVLHADPPGTAAAKTASLRVRMNSTTALTVASASDGKTSAVTLLATVDGTTSAAPGGSVVFTAQGKRVGEALVSKGAASITLTSLPTGLSTLSASYQGDENFLPSTSAAVRFYNDDQD